MQTKKKQLKIHQTLQKDLEKQKKAQFQRAIVAKQRLKKINQKNRARQLKVSRWKIYQEYLEEQTFQNNNSRIMLKEFQGELSIQKYGKDEKYRMITQPNNNQELNKKSKSSNKVMMTNSLVQQTRDYMSSLKNRTRLNLINKSRNKFDEGSIYSQPRNNKNNIDELKIENNRPPTSVIKNKYSQKSKENPQIFCALDGIQNTLTQEVKIKSQQTEYNTISYHKNNQKSQQQSAIQASNMKRISKFDQVFGLRYEQCQTLTKIRKRFNQKSAARVNATIVN